MQVMAVEALLNAAERDKKHGHYDVQVLSSINQMAGNAHDCQLLLHQNCALCVAVCC